MFLNPKLKIWRTYTFKALLTVEVIIALPLLIHSTTVKQQQLEKAIGLSKPKSAAHIIESSAAATQLRFVQQPVNTTVTGTITPYVTVEAVDINGNRDINFESEVMLTITSTGCGYLTGNEVIAVEGLAVFENLSPQVAENNITITASSKGLTSVVSNPFNVTASGAVTSTLVNWNFDDTNVVVDAASAANINRIFSAEVGRPSNIGFVAGAGTNGYAARETNWQNGMAMKYWYCEFETSGYQTLLISSKHRSSAKGPRDFKLQYKIGSGGIWTDIPGATVTITNTTNFTVLANVPLPAACNNQTSVFIRWIMTSNISVDGSTTVATGANHIDDVLIRGTTPSASAGYYFKTKSSGDFESPCVWSVSSDGLNWRQAPSTPDYTSGSIVISSGDSIKINTEIKLDELLVEENSVLDLGDVTLHINDGPGVDFVVNGTYIDGAASVHNVNFAANARWKLGPAATYIKTRNSSAVNYRDSYEGGMNQIPATAHWIIRYTGQSDVSFTTVDTYYPNLSFENRSRYPHYRFNQTFAGTVSFATVKGNLDVGGGSLQTVTVFNENTNANPMLVFGDCIIRKGDTLSNRKNLTSGRGFEVKGNLIVDGHLSVQSASSVVRLSGTDSQKIAGSGSIVLENLTSANTGEGVFMKKNLTVPGSLLLSSSIFSIEENNLSLLGNIQYQTGKLFGTNRSSLTIAGSGSTLGKLEFALEGQLLDTLKMDRNITSNSPAANLASSLSVNNLLLENGILTTGNHLLTFKNEGGLLSFPLPLSADYSKSYICLCDSNAQPVDFLKPFDGKTGFRINKVGANTFFPIGVDLKSSNRMWINNVGDVDDLTVVMEKGDIGKTPRPRVNRIWYIEQTDRNKRFSADMRLYFTKRDWTQGFPSFQDEIEPGFLWGDVHLVQKDYDDPNYIEAAVDADICNYLGAEYDEKEIYGKLSIGISPDASGSKDGIHSFNRFSIVNLTDIILPVKLGELKLSRMKDGVNLEFSAFDQEGVLSYEVERKSDESGFKSIGSIRSNHQKVTEYLYFDAAPLPGKNYYRIKVVNTDDRSYFSHVESIVLPEKQQFLLQPNPSTGKNIILGLKGFVNGIYFFTVFNTLGKGLVSIKIKHEAPAENYRLILPELVPGLYVGVLNGNGKIYTVKFLVE